MLSDDEDGLESVSSTQNWELQGSRAVPAQLEEEDEAGTSDFTLLASGGRKNLTSQAIRKGEKDFETYGTRAQATALENSRNVMESVLSHTRIHRQGQSWLRAWYFPDYVRDALEKEAAVAVEDEEDGAKAGLSEEEKSCKQREVHAVDRVVVLEELKGVYAHNIGRSIPGLPKEDPTRSKTWLLPEEALLLVERGSLDLWWPFERAEMIFSSATTEQDDQLPSSRRSHAAETGTDDVQKGLDVAEYEVGIPLSLEAVYSLLIGRDGEQGKITLQQYQVYASLRRQGFIVYRAPSLLPSQEVIQRGHMPPSIWRWLISIIYPPNKPTAHQGYGPLVTPGLYNSYQAVYRRLDLIARHKPCATPSAFEESISPFRIFYYIWKGGHDNFAKTSPPPPDYYLALVDAQSSFVPMLEEISALLASTPWSPPTAPPNALYPRLKHGYRNVLIAAVDHGVVNYVRFAEGAFGQHDLVPRFDGGGGPKGSKSGRGRDGGHNNRSRGRGRSGGRGHR
jgi:tRNA-splicing endonuclease subunit Sen54